MQEKGRVIPGKATIYGMGVHFEYKNVGGVNVSLVNAYLMRKGYMPFDVLKYVERENELSSETNSRTTNSPETLIQTLNSSTTEISPSTSSTTTTTTTSSKLEVDGKIYWQMTEPFHVSTIDFNQRPVLMKDEKEIMMVVTDLGVLTSIVYWYELELVPGVVISTSPFDPNRLKGSCLSQAIQHIPMVQVSRPCTLPVKATLTKEFVIFGVDPSKLPAEDAKMLQNPILTDPLLEEAQHKTMEIGSDLERMASATEKDSSEFHQSICRVASQGGAFGVDPQLAASMALARYS
eukprot:TRINITY_DN3868_c1_g2_i8.p1 TRINITY_DN3868_c1_g2~~TRINITY_DN3868_c1_g2_i8.p1  ORF type:complete len:292 (-),score=93.29 TRINITY_DN3868_c1_g2_i8:172-1047(-)